jgi:hypothetical protein
MARTIRDIAVPNLPPMEVDRFLRGWLAQNGFQVLDNRPGDSAKVLSHWDGDLVLHPKPGSLVALEERTGGATIVFELAILPSGDSSTLHFEGYTTGRGPGWKGKEYDFIPKVLAVAGVPRKRGFELLGELEKALTVSSAARPVADLPLPSAGAGRPPMVATDSSVLPARDLAARAKAYRWSDRRFTAKRFPFETEVKNPPTPAYRLESRLTEIISSLGFEVIFEEHPRFDGRPAKAATSDPHRGLIVGERGLRIDAGLRRRALVTGVVAAVFAIGLMAAAFWSITSGDPEPGLLAAPAGIMLAVALVSMAGTGSFDSDIAWVLYTPHIMNDGQAIDWRTPFSFDLRIGAGSIASRNWASRSSRGRNLKELKPITPDLSSVPTRIAEQLLASPPS